MDGGGKSCMNRVLCIFYDSRVYFIVERDAWVGDDGGGG